MKRIVVGIISVVSSMSYSQNKDKKLFEGTQSFAEKKYISAESDFRVSQSNNEQKKAVANYNLGNSIYRQNQPGEAKYKFLNAIEIAKTKEEKHKAFHNLGNTLMLEKNYQGAVEAYKNALRNNPADEETRYNYALAKQKLKENPPKDDKNKDKNKDKDKDKDQQNQDKKDQNDKNQDKKDKEDNGKDKDKKDSDKGKDDDKNKEGDNKKDKQDGDKKEDENGNPKPSGANKQQIENLLNAVNNAEKKIQDKVNAKKVKARSSTNEKDW